MSYIPPPQHPSPMPVIPPQSRAPVELLLQTEEDDEPTLKMQVPPHLLWSCRPESTKTRGPNWGLIIGVLFCLAFWGSAIYLFWRANG